jgi:NAD-dependent malate dehydrogenase
MSKEAKRILVTGAAGQIGYVLVTAVARGDLLGPDQPVILHMLDIAPMQKQLDGTVMELEDCAFPLLKGVVATTDLKTAFENIDICIMVGAFPRRPGMERKDLLEKNCGIFKEQGRALSDYAKKDVKVLVVGNPANTNCLIALKSAPGLGPQNFSALTRLDHNRAKSLLARRANAAVQSVKNVVIWGNHSSTQYPDVSHGTINGQAVTQAVNDQGWLQGEFISTVQQRGAAIINARGASSAVSAANAIIDHLRDWIFGTAANEFVSMAVMSDGSYEIPEGVIYSFPVRCKDGKYEIVQGLSVDEFSRKKMTDTYNELKEEKDVAFTILGI